MALLLHLWLPLPLLLALMITASSHGAPSGDDSYDPHLCLWHTSTCGNVSINYPFSLLDNGSSYCGYPGLAIRCKDGKQAVMQLGYETAYNVLGINYTDFTVSLVDQEVFEHESCPRVDHNVTTFPSSSWLDFPVNTVDYLVFFLDCNINMDWSPPINVSPITCRTYEEGHGRSFVALPPGDVPYEDWQEECNKIKLPVLKDVLLSWNWSDPQNLTAWRRGGFGSALHTGFQLVWKWEQKRSPSCNQCEGSSGHCRHNWAGEFVSCLCSDGRIGTRNICSAGKRGRNKMIAIIAGVVGGSVLLVAAVIAFFIIRQRKLKKGINSSSKLLKYSGSGGTPYSRGGDTESGSIQDPQTHLFSYEELDEATDGFNDNRELGDGGFGIVYKGYLKDGRVVAVKRLYNNSYRRMEQFMNEAEILSRLRHPNLVMFYGCTSSTSRELLLVYEFVANGTVADHLHGHRAAERALSWPLRLNIAVESAAALTYLHAIEQPIVHRDVKTTNILLDADFHVKVADFGLSRLFPLDATHVSTAPQGTPGYVDPEYHQCYQLTDKSDVYSFGVVLVELISSKPAVDITRHRNEINLAGMAINKIQKCQLEELVDLELGYESDPATKKMMTMVAELAFRCLQQNGEMRPPIKEVLEVLRSIQGELRMEKGGDKDKDHGPFSPNSVHAPWDSRATTPNTSRD